MPVSKVLSLAGKPYNKKRLSNGEVHYIYIERMVLPSGRREDRHYVFVVVQGKVTAKYLYQEGQDPLDLYLNGGRYGSYNEVDADY